MTSHLPSRVPLDAPPAAHGEPPPREPQRMETMMGDAPSRRIHGVPNLWSAEQRAAMERPAEVMQMPDPGTVRGRVLLTPAIAARLAAARTPGLTPVWHWTGWLGPALFGALVLWWLLTLIGKAIANLAAGNVAIDAARVMGGW